MIHLGTTVPVRFTTPRFIGAVRSTCLPSQQGSGQPVADEHPRLSRGRAARTSRKSPFRSPRPSRVVPASPRCGRATIGMRRGEILGSRSPAPARQSSGSVSRHALSATRVKPTKTHRAQISPSTRNEGDAGAHPRAPTRRQCRRTYLTKRVAGFKSHLGIENRHPAVIAARTRPPGCTRIRTLTEKHLSKRRESADRRAAEHLGVPCTNGWPGSRQSVG